MSEHFISEKKVLSLSLRCLFYPFTWMCWNIFFVLWIYIVRSMSQAAAATGRRRVFVVGVGMTKFEKVRRRIISSCRMCIVYVTGGALKANMGNIDLLMALSKWRKKIHTYLFRKCILLDLFFKSFKNYRTFTMNISVKSKLYWRRKKTLFKNSWHWPF